MGMSIEDIIQGLKETYMICCSVFAYDRKKYIDGAIDRLHKYQMMQTDYENRLKADMVAMLRFLWNDIENLDAPICDYASSDCISKWQVHEVIQQKINELKGNDIGGK